MIARSAIAILAALLVAVQAVRVAAVEASSGRDPGSASRIWAAHPDAAISSAMTQIAQASRNRQPVPATAFEMLDEAARRAPLRPEPFLVRGVQAQIAGDASTAESAFRAAQWRDPRSLAAAYFLADHYFRRNDAARGLQQVAALTRLAPASMKTVGPYVAAYAHDPANWSALRILFQRNPQLAEPTLALLARDPANAPPVLALASPGTPESRPAWLPILLKSLTDARQYREAKTIWARAGGVTSPANELIHDAGFRDLTSPGPFNWTLNSSAVGTAERQPGGRLHAIFYGSDDGTLASQLLILRPGKYRLTFRAAGGPLHALSWSLRCDKASGVLAAMPLDSAGERGVRFTVPGDCPGQWLELVGRTSDVSQQADVTVSALHLEPAESG